MVVLRARIRLISTLVLVAFAIGSGAGWAQSYDPDQDIPKPTLWEKRLNKLGRGISNVIFGWAEIPLTFDRKMKEGKPLAYLLAAVPVVGTAKALVRTGVGIKEVFTFGKTSPEVNYEAILEPEYVF
ncbi:MAG: exosortase system-associated protein, TIGR04073 family [Candidatus Hydrogenedentota bacterium]